MARPKAFAEQDALHAAMETFWRQGYHQTSMQDLVDSMGINRASLYDTFADKHTLYKLTLERYHDLNRADIAEAVAGLDSARAKIQTIFDRAVQETLDDSERRGCFMTNATLEMRPHYADVAPIIERHFNYLGTLFRSLLYEAIDQHECRTDLPVDETVAFLVSQLTGLRVLGKTNDPTLQAVVAVTMSVL